MSNDVVVDIPIEDIRAGVRAEIDSDLGGIAAQVFEKAKKLHGVQGQDGEAAAIPSGFTARSTRTAAMWSM